MSDVNIHHMRATYHLPRAGAADHSRLAAQLDRVAAELLAPSLEALAEPHDPRLYFIEHVDVAVRVDPQRPAVATGAWAGAIRRHVAQAVASDPSVVVFASRAAFEAAFLADLLRGRANGVWLYREFDALLPLSPGDAAANLLLRDGDTGFDTLLELAKASALDALLAAMTDSQVDEVARRCLLPSGTGGTHTASAENWLRAARDAASAAANGPTARGRALVRLYATILRDKPGLGPDRNLARFLDSLVRLADLLADSRDRQGFLDDLARGGGCLARLAGDGARLSGIVRSLGPAGRELQGETVGRLAATPDVSPVTTEFSRYVGLFLLVPTVIRLELDKRFLFDACDSAREFQTLLYGLALSCLGLETDTGARPDPGPRWFAGLAVPPTAAQVRDTALRLERAGGSFTALAEEVMSAFAATLGDFAVSSAEFLRANFLFSTGTAALSDDALALNLEHCPLRVVLQLAGFGHNHWAIPWFGGRRLSFRFE